MEHLNELISKEYLAKLDRLVLSIREKLSQQGYSGTRKSLAKGNSLEFSDFREYTAGDDLRRVDWNSYSRLDRLYLKLFMEEKQATVSLFLDNSASMGMEKKMIYAKALAASLSYITLQSMDKLNILSWNQGLNAKKTHVHNKTRFLEIIHFLDGIQAFGETNLSKSIHEFCKQPLVRGVSIVISDFLSEENWEESIKLLQYQKQDVIFIWILSAEEKEPTLQGNIRLQDVETNAAWDMEITNSILTAYQKELSRYEAYLKELCKKKNVRFFSVVEGEPLLNVITRIVS
jgi:uncharacterized protein (DUF58 family)